MKKFLTFIFTIALILNLLPQPSEAFRLSEDNNSVIYGDWDGEQERWEQTYLPHAKHAKLVNKNATMLDIAKMYKDEQEKGIFDTIVHKIMKATHHERGKMLVRWERDNGYIDTEGEEDFKITPTIRRELLKEIEEEKEKQSFWNTLKVGGKVLTTATSFVVARFIKKDIKEAWTIATLAAVTIATVVIDIADFTIKRYNKKGNDDEEIKIPPLRNMPKIPANHTKVDLYSL